MTTRRIIEIAAFCIALLVAALAVHAWLASRDDQRRRESTLSTQKQIIDAATADQQTSALKLKDTLAQIDKLKSATQTPEQILRELPKYLPLPEPITMAGGTSSAGGAGLTAGAATSQQQGIVTSQFPTAPDAAKSSESASSEFSRPSNSKSADTLPAAASGAADRATDSRLKAFLDFFREAGKAKPVRSSPPSPVCQPESGALTANPAASITLAKSADGDSSHERIPDPAAAPAGNFTAGKTNPAASPLISESTDDASPKSPGSNSNVGHIGDSNGPAGSSNAGKTRQAAVPCVPETSNDGTNNAKAQQSTLGVATLTPEPPPDTPAPQPPVEPGANAQIPAADLKPLFDFVQDCRSCNAQLKAATQNQADNSAKILALTKERDAAITAGNGGNFLRRLRRNALWFAVGAGVGVTAAYAAALR